MRTIALTIAALLLASLGPALVWEPAKRDPWQQMRRSSNIEDRRSVVEPEVDKPHCVRFCTTPNLEAIYRP